MRNRAKVCVLVLASLIGGAGCNWWLSYYEVKNAQGVVVQRWNTSSWNANNVEFSRCLLKPTGGWYYCNVRQSQIKSDGCMHATPTDWCVGQAPPGGVDAVYIVNY